MSDKPILFSKPMVQALLAGTKTQTRRPISTKPSMTRPNLFDGSWADSYVLDPGNKEWRDKSLRIAVGDRLYVRETWSGIHAFRNTPPAQRESCMTPDGPLLRDDIWFWADGNPDSGDYEKPRPGIHMPRWASRLTLTVTDVRVQRLQDISPEDAQAEGVDRRSRKVRQYNLFGANAEERAAQYLRACVWEYEELWDAINGVGAWASNPWVAAYSFTVEHRNIDQ